MKRNTLNNLKSDYEELEIKPSADLWDRLDEKLAETPAIALKTSFQWWKYAAVVLLLISLGTIIYFNDKNELDRSTDYIVKKRTENVINTVTPEFDNHSVDSKEDKKEGNNIETVAEVKKTESDKVSGLKLEKEKILIKPQVLEFKSQQFAIKQSENINIETPKIKNQVPNIPVIAETKKVKSTYINADELLFGREFDKNRENPYKNDIKFGVFNFEKPKVENVTVLGVAVYIDSK